MTEYEKKESNFLKVADVQGVDGLTLTILEEVSPVSTDFGQKDQAKVKVEGHGEAYEKIMTFNQTTINWLIDNISTNSKDWIGKSLKITTKKIKGNEAIVPKDSV